VDGFWGRLKQSKLVQWALAYIAAAFALLQVLDVVAQRFAWPDRIEKVIILALVVGLFVALVLAWYHGERGAQKVGGTELLIIALLLAIGGGALWAYARAPATPVVAVAKPAAPAPAAGTHPAAPKPFDPPADTLVVLPFVNLDKNPQQQYFSDGITEELTNALGQSTALQVIAWDTASKYRDSKLSATDIGKALNVASVLTGKILRQGSEVRVIVELVNARTGYQTWSSHYDDSLSNIFQVQDKITASISDALKVKFASARPTTTVNPEAHDLVLKGLAGMNGRVAGGYEQARKHFEQAIAIDPDYAAAHAALARTLIDLTQYSTLSLQEALPEARAEAHKALARNPNNVDAIVALANADLIDGNDANARAGYERAIKLDPSNAVAYLNYGVLLPPAQALAQNLKAVQLDPQQAVAQNNLSSTYLDLGDYRKALPVSEALARMSPSPDTAFGLAQNYALVHRDVDAVKAFDLAQPTTELARQLVAVGKLTYQSVLDPKLRPQARAALDTLRERSDLDPTSLADLLQVYLILDEKDAALDLLDKLIALTPQSYSDLSVNPVFIPLRGDPRFEALVKKYDVTSQPAASSSSSP